MLTFWYIFFQSVFYTIGQCILFPNLYFALKNDVDDVFPYYLKIFSISFKMALSHSITLLYHGPVKRVPIVRP